MNVTVTIIEKKGGKYECLYVGTNTNEALAAAAKPIKDAIEVCVFRRPVAYKSSRRGSKVVSHECKAVKSKAAKTSKAQDEKASEVEEFLKA